MNPGQFGLEKLLKPWSSSSQFLAAPQGPWGLAGVLWAWALSISDSCLGEVEADTPFFFLPSLFEQVPTPEGKQHTGGQRGQSNVWTQPLPTDPACQSLDLACLDCWEELSHRSTWAWHDVKRWGSDCHGEGGCLLNPGLNVSMQTPCSRARVVEAPPVKGRQPQCGG